MKEVILDSKAVLKIDPAPFAVSKSLYQAVIEEMKSIKIDVNVSDGNFFKDIFCVTFSSKRVELALDECMKRVLYNGNKISAETWEPIEAREDYTAVCFEVLKENLTPFMKSLYAQYAQILAILQGSRA